MRRGVALIRERTQVTHEREEGINGNTTITLLWLRDIRCWTSREKLMKLHKPVHGSHKSSPTAGRWCHPAGHSTEDQCHKQTQCVSSEYLPHV